MFSAGRLILSLVVSTVFISSPAIFAEEKEVQVNFISGLPKNTDEFSMRCGDNIYTEHGARLKPGEENQWILKENMTKSCDSHWGLQFRYYEVLEAGGDYAGKTKVFWLIKEDGFYRSWDKTNWNHTYDWDHE